MNWKNGFPIAAVFILASACNLAAQGISNPAPTPWYSSTPPTSCPGALPVYIIAPGFTGAGTLYGNTSASTGTTCAALNTPGAGGTVTTTGSPASGNPAVFSGSTSIRPATSGDAWPGNAASATALAAAPSGCAAGAVVTAMSANGTPTCTGGAVSYELTSCRISTPVSTATGTSGAAVAVTSASCPIPSGTLGATSHIDVHAAWGLATGGGTCLPLTYIDSTQNAVTNGRNFSQGFATSTTVVILDGRVQNIGGTAQNSVGFGALQGNLAISGTVSTAINTATTTFFIDYGAIPSTNATACQLLFASVFITP